MSTDLLGAHETAAIVNHGRMFITTPQNNIIALDAKTGTQLWRYTRKYPDGLFQLHPTNRGVALYGDYVYMATTDCALVALDAAPGKEVWKCPLADYRPGANLYPDSTLALDADTGKIKSYHQYTPHDSFDWDEVSAPLLIDTAVDGKLTKTATHAGRNGYLWILDRDGLKFLHAFPFANNNVFTSIDQNTGRPTVDESKRPGAHQGAEFCPSIGGGKDLPPAAWSPQTKLLYIPSNTTVSAYLPKRKAPEADSKGSFVGYDVYSIFGSVRTGPGAH